MGLVGFVRLATFLGLLEHVCSGCGWVWLGLIGFGWVWFGLVGFGWVWLGLVGFGGFG